ncbi:hypothetical protein SEA_FAUST_212 [Streptomyces phage Faust]|uniref:Uncharacterized protein n=1 Tax=Streptomyces phage Faust TaxID=2767565 RepID=A0A7G9UZ29_9CAUD|nr:hypothetical protein PP456_gp075 [Streptomyces phage Faust]QNN99284.1 hypothetical protein SEA_FAUST_212 [Streptomyces phage Faust]
MKVSARIVKKNGRKSISIKRLGKQTQAHSAGTVVMTGVKFGKTILGTVVEELERAYMPRAKSEVGFTKDGDLRIVSAVSDWPQARYIGSLGGYYNTKTGERVTEASFVYMAGDRIYFTK